MPKMSIASLRALLAAEKADALAAVHASKLSQERADALDYYLGDVSRDMPVADGRSPAVSSDVADTIEGLMPSLMDIFAGSDEVVRFEPVGPEDEAAAQQETDYVNHVFMQQNPGFMVTYGFIKDALLSKVGIVKVWWETREETERETYCDLDDAAFAIIAADPSVEIVEHTQRSLPQAPPALPAAGPGSAEPAEHLNTAGRSPGRRPSAVVPEWHAARSQVAAWASRLSMAAGSFLGSEVAPGGREVAYADGAAELLGGHADGLGEGGVGELHLGELLDVHARAHGGRDDLDGFG